MGASRGVDAAVSHACYSLDTLGCSLHAEEQQLMPTFSTSMLMNGAFAAPPPSTHRLRSSS
jgi:hypothetical protein